MGKQQTTVLIIEDEPAILLGLKDELSLDYEVLSSETGKDGLNSACENKPDLILLDILLPDIDGFKICQMIKSKGIDASIIMLTACDQVVDKIKGLELGADDYVTKPFNLAELKARITAVLRRKQLMPITEYKDSELFIDFKNYKARKNRKPLKLSYLEFKILRLLISRSGEVVSREDLLEQVWGYEVTPSTRTVDAHIVSLRKEIGKKYIDTIHGRGYIFTPQNSGI